METQETAVSAASLTSASDDAADIISAADCDEGSDPHYDSSPPSENDDVDEDHPPEAQSNGSTEQLRARILRQVEYYFSDRNLLCDVFLMKHLRMDEEGFVLIPLIASFGKMKKLTTDYSLIADALRESSELVVSEDGKKVKRSQSLIFSEVNDPKLCALTTGVLAKNCTVVIENLPEDHSKENIQRIFGEVGKIRCICVYHPTVAEDSDTSKIKNLISSKMHALVEYEMVEAAEKAAATLNDKRDWRNGLRVNLLHKRKACGFGRKARKLPDPDKSSDAQVGDLGGVKDNNNLIKQNAEAHPDEEGNHPPKERNGRKNRNQRSRGHKQHRGNNGIGGNGTKGPVSSEASKPPPGPRMPDGTRGFAMGRGRPFASG